MSGEADPRQPRVRPASQIWHSSFGGSLGGSSGASSGYVRETSPQTRDLRRPVSHSRCGNAFSFVDRLIRTPYREGFSVRAGTG
jgi:hypothetical protein